MSRPRTVDKKELVKILDRIQLDPNDIFELEDIPSNISRGNVMSGVSGKTLYSILEEYGSSVDTLATILKKHKVTNFQWLKVKNWGAVQNILTQARREKSDYFVEASDAIYLTDKEFNSKCIQTTSQGTNISSAGVAFLKNKADHYMKRAALLDRVRYSEKGGDVSININSNNVVSQAPANLDELESIDISDLVKVSMSDL